MLTPLAPMVTPLTLGLAGHGDRPAVLTGHECITYSELAARVEETAFRLGGGRRLVLLAAANALDSLVVYLAALSAGHPVILVPEGDEARLSQLTAVYDPDVVVRRNGADWTLDERHEASVHDLHPDLALLLSTSGSTGSPKLVRLSHENLRTNAEAIADFLGIRSTDRAATTLPMHYCYGLSVINSHLIRGAGLVLTDRSVADTRFWDLFRDSRATSFAGVPHTFDLLDRVGFADLRLPDLRQVTQAGGRLAPETVRRYALLGRRHGWEFFVMYGQTEATARMAYLPPGVAVAHPEAIGVPIKGGTFRLQPLPGVEGDSGELVYTGPNVMMGYVQGPPDLRTGCTVRELHTGDIARRASDGLYEIVGRRSRTAKIFGLRIDLDHVEALLAERGVSACCVEGDAGLSVLVEGQQDTDRLRSRAARLCGLPPYAVAVRGVAELPRLPSGKPDLCAVRGLALAADPRPVSTAEAASPPGDRTRALVRLYADLLHRTDVTEDSTFVSLDGDSLSYVELSVRLENQLGHLPAQWHTTPIRELAGSRRRRRTLGRGMDASVVLRAVAIVLVVGSHANVFTALGGAHALLAVAGFNFARFQLTSAPRSRRVRSIARSTARITLPCVAWIAAVHVLTNQYGLANIVLLNDVVGPDRLGPQWQFWFIESLVYILVLLMIVLAVPALDRAERRWPLGVVAALFLLGLSTRFGLVGTAPGPSETLSALTLFWLFTLGWAAAKAASWWRRLAVTGAAVATVPGFFADPVREAVVLGAVLLLLWVPTLPVPRHLHRAVGMLATSSLYIYLTHWQVFPHLQDRFPLLALGASLAVGVAYWKLTAVVAAGLARASQLAAAARAVALAATDGGAPAGLGLRLRVQRDPG